MAVSGILRNGANLLRMTQKQYSDLSIKEIEVISLGRAVNLSFAEIVRQIGDSTATVSREVKSNYGRDAHRCCSADRKAQKLMGRRRSGKRKLFDTMPLCRYVFCGLKREWAPDEIVSRLRMDYTDDMTIRFSAETVYRYIYVSPRGKLKATLIKGLRQEHKYGLKRESKAAETKETRVK